LTDDERGAWAREQLATETSAAPHVLDLEVLSALRKRVLRNELSAERAEAAVVDLGAFACRRYGVVRLLDSIWRMWPNVTPYDGAYLALATVFDCPLVTTDVRLARAPGLPVQVRTP
jgi:predicted nucleic acid-binding protein